MHDLGFRYFRISISPARMFPSGMRGEPNPEAVRFYSDVIDCMVAKGVQPAVTLYHWDLPQYLEDEGGWMNPDIVSHMKHYAQR